MRRYYLKVGDKSSAGGVVLEGEPTCTHHGTPMTYLGAKVYCHTCQSVGVIVGKGPRLRDMMMGKEAALDGDICVCKCERSPIMIASQNNAFQEVNSEAPATPPAAENTHQSKHGPQPPYPGPKHVQRIFVWDSSTGEPLKNHRFIAEVEGTQQSDRTDEDGYATIETGSAKTFRIHVVFSSPKRDLIPSQGA